MAAGAASSVGDQEVGRRPTDVFVICASMDVCSNASSILLLRVFIAVKSKVTDNLSKHSSPETQSAPGQPWVRGWDDKRGVDGPKCGNE
uniref:Uncharacterized protein n=1 Tax=Leersia perrieri TaxID=77586 RepID=A0A0D9XBW7_9ORYZ